MRTVDYKIVMLMFFNKLIAWYGRFSMLLLLVDAKSCKNETAAKNIAPILEQKNATISNSLEVDQKGDSITPKSNSERSNNHAVQVDTPPTFTLQDITIQAGTQQSTLLEVTGITEGYSIKSISVTKNGTYCTKAFGITELNKKPILLSGLPITLTPDPTLKAGSYALKIQTGKTGKGSQKTEQWVKCRIHVTQDKAKNNCPSKDEADTAENIQTHQKQNHTTLAKPSFTLQDITIQAGTQQSTLLEVAGTTEGYSIKSISVTKNGTYYTKAFGVTELNKKPIPLSGLPITLTPDPTLKAGSYALKIQTGKTGKGSQKTKQWVKCRIHVTQDEAKKSEKQSESCSATQTIQTLNSEVK